MARLNELYRWVRLYVNFFLPSQKLQQKIREGSRVYKRYDRAQTPYQRVLESEAVSDEHKGKLRAQYQRWNPAELHRQIRRLQEELLARHRGLPVPACACPHADRPNSSRQAGQPNRMTVDDAGAAGKDLSTAPTVTTSTGP